MRVHFNKQGTPIPEFALPETQLSSDIPPMTITPPDGTIFHTADYVAMGFTHYECWCVGAAGGRGANGYGSWTAKYYSVPNETKFHLGKPYLDGINSYGGEGGGGGVHRVAGLLADLPEDITVEVGQATSLAANIGLLETYPWYNSAKYPKGFIDPITLPERMGPTEADRWTFDYPNDLAYPPVDGPDGGYSKFASCEASGGKGGKRAGHIELSGSQVYPVKTIFEGSGGEGGLGGRILAGGGGAGSPAQPWTQSSSSLPDPSVTDELSPQFGSDGTWNGSIGGGGGGGRGGIWVPSGSSAEYGNVRETLYRMASGGGQGAFSYVDTSIYGPRGQAGGHTIAPYPEGYIPATHPIVPGAGGGAKPKAQGYGSRAPGFDPNGVVIVRLLRLV